MKRVKSLILLVNTLSKVEKKSIYLHSGLTGGKKIYMDLFELIDKLKIDNSADLLKHYTLKHTKASFHPEVKYLYDFILNVLVKLKINQDNNFNLHRKLLNAKILKDRNLDSDYYSMLQQIDIEANEFSSYHISLEIKRMELDFLRENSFKGLSERQLLKKQYKISETLKILRQINEQSSLYELLLHRIEKTPSSRSELQKKYYSDLLISEISVVSSLNKEVFEIQKLHQLFQAHYLSNMGDYKSALNSFFELDKLFSANQSLWKDYPLYYVSVLEGILKSLKANGLYSEMPYFIEKLGTLHCVSLSSQTEIACIQFIYIAESYIYAERYIECLELIDKYKESLIQKEILLTPYRYLQLSLQLAIIYLLNKKHSLARRQLIKIISSEAYSDFSLFRIVQLINLLIYYELGDVDFISSQIRSLKRQNRINKKVSNLEDFLYYFLSIDIMTLNQHKKEELRLKIEKEFELIKNKNEERDLQSIFDLRKWMLLQLN